MKGGCQGLTEKEKQTLRLLLVGHDAKSAARHLGLSVHTVNERLRDARRKLSVSSSREAARLLRQSEAADPEWSGDRRLGDAGSDPTGQQVGQPNAGSLLRRPAVWAIGGLAMITMLAALLALSSLAQVADTGAGTPVFSAAQTSIAESAATRTARDWLAMVDDGKWQESWAATGRAFRSLNSVEAWRAASEKERVPLGAVRTRVLLSEQDIPAPPNGYRLVRFRTEFANKASATETLSLDYEGDSWRVVGCYIE